MIFYVICGDTTAQMKVVSLLNERPELGFTLSRKTNTAILNGNVYKFIDNFKFERMIDVCPYCEFITDYDFAEHYGFLREVEEWLM